MMRACAFIALARRPVPSPRPGVMDRRATMQSVVDIALGDLPGKIVVIEPLTSDTSPACGEFELAVEP